MSKVSVEFEGGRPREEEGTPIRITFHEGPNEGTDVVIKKGSKVYLGDLRKLYEGNLNKRVHTLHDVFFSSHLESPVALSSASASASARSRNSTRKRRYTVTTLIFHSKRKDGIYRTVLHEKNFSMLQRLERVKKSFSSRRTARKSHR
jgi:hypothetical protein